MITQQEQQLATNIEDVVHMPYAHTRSLYFICGRLVYSNVWTNMERRESKWTALEQKLFVNGRRAINGYGMEISTIWMKIRLLLSMMWLMFWHSSISQYASQTTPHHRMQDTLRYSSVSFRCCCCFLTVIFVHLLRCWMRIHFSDGVSRASDVYVFIFGSAGSCVFAFMFLASDFISWWATWRLRHHHHHTAVL